MMKKWRDIRKRDFSDADMKRMDEKVKNQPASTVVVEVANDYAALEVCRHPDNPDICVLRAVDRLMDDTEIVLWFSQDQLRKFCEATLAELNHDPFDDQSSGLWCLRLLPRGKKQVELSRTRVFHSALGTY